MGKPLNEWSQDDLDWGLVGCGHDLDNALEMLKDANTLKDAKAASKEYMDVWKCSERYEKEIKRRMKEKTEIFTDEEVRGIVAKIEKDITPQDLKEARERGKDFLQGKSCFDDGGDWE